MAQAKVSVGLGRPSEREIVMRFRIRFSARLAFLSAAMAAILAPASASAVDHEFTSTHNSGSFAVSLSDAELRAGGLGQGTFVGRYTYEMHLALSPSAVPLARDFTGTIVFTSLSGAELTLSLTGTVYLQPNENLVVIDRARVVVVGGTGRFADATGGGAFGFMGMLDDSGVQGNQFINVDTIITLP